MFARHLLSLALVLAPACAASQTLPRLAELVGTADAKSRRVEPLAKHDFAARIVSPDERRGWLFELDMAAAAGKVAPAVSTPYDAKALATASAECERIANTVYRLFMYAHANAGEWARTSGGKGAVEYAAPYRAMHNARESLSAHLKTAVELRDQWSTASSIPPRPRLEELSARDVRELLSDAGLREYRRRELISNETLESLLALPPIVYKKDQPGWSTDAMRDCANKCQQRQGDCGRCTRTLSENAEASYAYFAAQWNANDRWYQFWRRIELTDNLLGMLGAGYSPRR